MNNFPRQTLRRILTKYGREICSDAGRCEALLNDLCGEYRREINVLVNALEERVPLDLLAAAKTNPPELLFTKLEKRLEEQIAMTPEAARWAVHSWALALDVVTEAELEERERKQSAAASGQAAATQPTESRSNPSRRETLSVEPPKTVPAPKTQLPPVNTSKSAAPSSAPPTKIQYPLPPPASSSPNNQPPIQPQGINPRRQPANPAAAAAATSKSPFRLFRGCLIIVFLFAVASVALFFGVPYAFKVMRETQSERNNDPPRFPAR